MGHRVRAHLPAKPINSVSERELCATKNEKGKCQPFRGIFLLFFIFPRRVGTISRRVCTIPEGAGLFHLNLADLHGVQCIPVLLRGDAGTAFFQDTDWGFREGCFENHGVGNHTDIRAQTY